MDMFHATENPIIVTTEQDFEAALRKHYGEVYIHQAYDKSLYGHNHTAASPVVLIVSNPDEHKAALADGWSETIPELKPKAKQRPPGAAA
jgi:hypothetical protein